MGNTFPKSERLKSRKLIDQLFEEGKSEFEYPVKFFYRQYPDDTQRPKVFAGVSVSKRNFKKAVDRNRIKRQLRELYRLNKAAFVHLVEEGKVMDCMLVYVGKTMEDYHRMEKSIKNILQRLM